MICHATVNFLLYRRLDPIKHGSSLGCGSFLLECCCSCFSQMRVGLLRINIVFSWCWCFTVFLGSIGLLKRLLRLRVYLHNFIILLTINLLLFTTFIITIIRTTVTTRRLTFLLLIFIKSCKDISYLLL